MDSHNLPNLFYFANRLYDRLWTAPAVAYDCVAGVISKSPLRRIEFRPGAVAPRHWLTPAGSQHSFNGVTMQPQICRTQPGSAQAGGVASQPDQPSRIAGEEIARVATSAIVRRLAQNKDGDLTRLRGVGR